MQKFQFLYQNSTVSFSTVFVSRFGSLCLTREISQNCSPADERLWSLTSLNDRVQLHYLLHFFFLSFRPRRTAGCLPSPDDFLTSRMSKRYSNHFSFTKTSVISMQIAKEIITRVLFAEEKERERWRDAYGLRAHTNSLLPRNLQCRKRPRGLGGATVASAKESRTARCQILIGDSWELFVFLETTRNAKLGVSETRAISFCRDLVITTALPSGRAFLTLIIALGSRSYTVEAPFRPFFYSSPIVNSAISLRMLLFHIKWIRIIYCEYVLPALSVSE